MFIIAHIVVKVNMLSGSQAYPRVPHRRARRGACVLWLVPTSSRLQTGSFDTLLLLEMA